jgi:5-methylcytosine-specific restriction endonuclease McrA
MTIPCDDLVDYCVETESDDKICASANSKSTAHIIRQLSDTKYLVKCLWCEKEFETYQCKIRNSRGKYCSKSCRNTSNGYAQYVSKKGMFRDFDVRGTKNPNWGGGDFQDCVICGKPFWKYPSRNTETCSNECGWERAELTRKGLLPTIGHRNQYKGIKNWKYLRIDTLTRDDFTCQKCKINYAHMQQFLHAHHVIYLKNGGENDTTNLITLCKSCHFELHNLAGDLRKR